MGLTSKSGHARTDINNPVAFKVCDRCARWRNADDLVWQYQWAGNDLLNLRLLVCFDRCLDVPQQQLRSIVLPPDPIPTKDPRLEPFQQDAVGGNLAGVNPLDGPVVPGGNPAYNWNQPGANWNQPTGQQWDLQEVPEDEGVG